MIDLKIRGHEELIEMFEKLPDEIRTKALKIAEQKNAKVVKEFVQVKVNSNVKTGKLQRSVKSKVKVYAKSVHAKVTISGEAYYGYILGHGWETRNGKWIEPKFDLTPTPALVAASQENIRMAIQKAVEKSIMETTRYNKQYDKL